MGGQEGGSQGGEQARTAGRQAERLSATRQRKGCTAHTHTRTQHPHSQHPMPAHSALCRCQLDTLSNTQRHCTAASPPAPELKILLPKALECRTRMHPPHACKPGNAGVLQMCCRCRPAQVHCTCTPCRVPPCWPQPRSSCSPCTQQEQGIGRIPFLVNRQGGWPARGFRVQTAQTRHDVRLTGGTSCAAQHSTAQHDTEQRSAALHSTAQRDTLTHQARTLATWICCSLAGYLAVQGRRGRYCGRYIARVYFTMYECTTVSVCCLCARTETCDTDSHWGQHGWSIKCLVGWQQCDTAVRACTGCDRGCSFLPAASVAQKLPHTHSLLPCTYTLHPALLAHM